MDTFLAQLQVLLCTQTHVDVSVAFDVDVVNLTAFIIDAVRGEHHQDHVRQLGQSVRRQILVAQLLTSVILLSWTLV